jgi:hypothetical protein
MYFVKACRRKPLFELGLLTFYPILHPFPLLMRMAITMTMTMTTTVGDCDEVERYLRLPQIALHSAFGHDHDILYWWKQHTPDFPFLSKMARQFLASLASSAGLERLFSGARMMHDDLKKSTDELTLENQLLISMNFPDA